MFYRKTVRFFSVFLSVCILFSAFFTVSAANYRVSSGSCTLDFNDADAIDSGVSEKILEIFKEVYPKMAEKYNPNAPKKVYCKVDTAYDGVAYAYGNNIVVSSEWLKKNPNDVDCITHELFHVVQSYSTYDSIWLIEGMTDYARYQYGLYNDLSGWGLPEYTASQKYTDSYSVTARFLLWTEKYVNPEFIIKLDDLFYTNTYTAESWVTLTGKTVDALWAEYAANPDITRFTGDVDLDGSIDVSDVVSLRKAIMNGDTRRIFDVDYDWANTVSDVVELRKMIMKS